MIGTQPNFRTQTQRSTQCSPLPGAILARLFAAVLLFGGAAQLKAQFDNFNDGNDTNAPPAWLHYDPLARLTALPASFLCTNGGYRIYAPTPAVPDAGSARAGSFLTNSYYEDAFYVSADIIDFDDTVRQVFGIAARIRTPGLGSTCGYLLSWEPGSGALPGTDNGDLDISPLVNEVPSGQIEIGNSHLHLTRGKSYRFVFTGRGFDFEGRVYELPDTTNALIRLPAHDPDGRFANGYAGLVAAANPDAPTAYADATFDNFFASDHDPQAFCDSFNDGDDVNPAPPWFHYDPLLGLTSTEPASFLFTNGGYRIYAPVPVFGNGAGDARAGSFLTNVTLLDFYVAADLIDFDDTVRQIFGVAARVNAPGLSTTSGYLFSWEPGSGALPGTDNGDLDISVLEGEQAVSQIETGPGGLHLTRGKSYRFVFMGKGPDFEGQVYELPDTEHPLIRVPAHDPLERYTNGCVGLVAASNPGANTYGDATFDNFLATSLEPRLTVTRSGNNVTVSWPVFTSYVLEQSSSLVSPNWTLVTSGIAQNQGMSIYQVSGVAGPRFYRLRCACN